jgi:hypothetical protein
MHAVVVTVTIKDRERAQAALRDRVVPMVSGAPGFVGGYWVSVSDDQGASIAVFESEEAARAMAGQVDAAPAEGVSIDSVQVGEVVAHA